MSKQSLTRQIILTIGEKPISFLLFFLFIFGSSFGLLYVLDLVPEELKSVETDADSPSRFSWLDSLTTTPQPVVEQGQLPVRIVINRIGVNTVIHNPSTTNNSVLDELLTKGVVRYPGSGLAGNGNMFLFGHSTGLRVVNNPAYKAFNNIKTLLPGEEIVVYSENKKYIYAVRDVKLVDSTQAWVDLSVTKSMLTLSTCNTFGTKEQRHVVQADFVRSESL